MSNTEAPAPIMVNATPGRAQLEAGIRQVALAGAAIATTIGAVGFASKLNLVLVLAPQITTLLVTIGPVALGAAVWIGQHFTRKTAKALATVTASAPNNVAMFK